MAFANSIRLPEEVHLAIIGGTGLSTLDGFKPVATINPETPWGFPSSPITILMHNTVPVAFLSRHGLHHHLAPHEVNSRANIAALRHIGVRCVVAFSAVGSLQEEIKPMDFVVPDQVIDRTKGIRPFTFFDGGLVGHVGFGDPFDNGLAKVVMQCADSMKGDGVKLHEKGLVVCMGELQAHGDYGYLLLTTSPSRGSPIFHTCGIEPLPVVGWLRHQHVRSSRSKVGPGG